MLLLIVAPYFETIEPVIVDSKISVVIEQVYNAPLILLDPDIDKVIPWFIISPWQLLPLIARPPFEKIIIEFEIEWTLDPNVLFITLISPLLAISMPPEIIQFVIFISPDAYIFPDPVITNPVKEMSLP